MNIFINNIGFNLIDTTTKASKDAQFTCRDIDVNYDAFIGQKNEFHGTLRIPATDHICLAEIKRTIQEQIKNG